MAGRWRIHLKSSHVGREGWTLIELLVVLSILLLLVLLLVPGLMRVRHQARRIGCGSNLKVVGQALNVYRAELGNFPDIGVRNGPLMFMRPDHPVWRYGDKKPGARAGGGSMIADLAAALVLNSLGDPRLLYCPAVGERQAREAGPYVTVNKNTRAALWRTGEISYYYLMGHDIADPANPKEVALYRPNWYPDADGIPTYNIPLETPDVRTNKTNPRVVLIGDRANVPYATNKKLPGSNHGREGGWFCFTTGDVKWYDWERLSPHPVLRSDIYWPRTAPRPSQPLPVSFTGLQ